MCSMLVDVYCRISKDKTGAGLGVERQEGDCREHLATLGHDVGQVLVDNDITAYKRKRRPDYEVLLDRLKNGQSDGFIVWHLDRLTRTPRELEDVIDLVEATHSLVLTVTGGDYDLSTTDGRAMARVVCAFARKESEDKARRNRRKHLELAQAGRPVGGTRHFGYEPLYTDGTATLLDASGHPTLKIRPAEADLIRQAIDRLLAGESMRAIAYSWNDAGVVLSRGAKRVGASPLRRILLSPTIAGQRSLAGQIVAPGTWEAIVDLDTFQKVRAVIESRAALHGGQRVGPRTYVLSGLARCGLCGARLVSQLHGDRSKRSYQCPIDPQKGGCGRIRIVAPETEHEVFQRLLLVLDERLLVDAPAPDTGPLISELDSLDADQRRLATDYYVEHLVERSQFFAASEALTARITQVQRQIAETVSEEALRPLLGDTERLRATWDQLEIGRRRAILDRWIDHVVVHPASVPRGRFDERRLEVLWRA